MRPIVFPLLFVVVGCAAGEASKPTSEAPPQSQPQTTATGSVPPNPASWSDAIVGDGEIPGDVSGEGAYGDAPPMAPGSGSSSGGSGSTSGGTSSAGASSSGGSSGSSGSSGAMTGSSGSSGNGSYPGPGILTAGTWDDNRNFPFFTSYRNDFLQTNAPGTLLISQDEANGASAAFAGARGAKTSLDVSLVIDTTGSMGDEIAYLQSEFTSLVSTIEAKYPGAEQHWSLVLYKDKHDDYIVQWFDFRADTAELKSKLMTARAGGGGDFPESPERAIDIANRLSWRRDANVARLMFWVADAPHHAEDTPNMTAAVKASRDKNIHIYPVASSGVDEFTEYTMRSTAQLTGGRYIFLTDDSGVGNAHEEPTVPCYFVTKLDKAILRMVDVELTGTYREPTSDEVLRTAGDPQGGVCKVGDATVSIY